MAIFVVISPIIVLVISRGLLTFVPNLLLIVSKGLVLLVKRKWIQEFNESDLIIVQKDYMLTPIFSISK